ncbi:hypothetical protein ACFLT9_07020 [Acidobacteriota bacterium]
MLITKRFVLIVLIILLMIVIIKPVDSKMVVRKTDNSSISVDLDELLVKAATYAERLERSVLYFVCREEIKEWIDPTLEARSSYRSKHRWARSDPVGRRFISRLRAKKIKKSYVYDYQCIRKEEQILARRTLIEEDGKTKNEPNVSLKTSIFRYGTNMMGPVGLFGARFQPGYDYTIVGKEKKKGKEFIVIEAKPKSENPTSTNLYGRAWILTDTGDILKIEWNESRIGNYEIFEERGKQFKRTPRIKVETEFEIEKNGLRFPTRWSLEEAYCTKYGRAFVRSKTTVEYKDFQFFTVEVEIK